GAWRRSLQAQAGWSRRNLRSESSTILQMLRPRLRVRASRSAIMPAMRPDDLDDDLTIETLAVHAGQEPDPQYGAVAPPIYQTSTYRQEGVGRPIDDFDYARTKNPTRDRFERAVARLEGGGFGIAFASGSAATAAISEFAGAETEIVV